MPSAIPVLYSEPSWLRIVPSVFTTNSTSEMASLGAKIDFPYAIKATPTHTGAAAAAETTAKWLTTEIANGNKLSVADISTNTNITSGETISEDNNTATTGKMDCSIVPTPAQRTLIINAHENGTPVIVSREIGKVGGTGAIAGYEYLLGTITDLKDNPGKGPSTMDFSVVGKVVGAGGSYTIKETTPSTPDFDETEYNAAATGASNTITPHNDGSARTVTDLTSADWTRLLSGKIVTKVS